MKNKDIFFSIIHVFTLYIIVAISITGCGLNDNVNDPSNEKNEVAQSTITPTESTTENEEIDTSISSGYCLSLGVLDQNVVQNGPDRDESELSIYNKKLLFPQGAVRTICIKSFSRQEKAYNSGETEVKKLVNEIEGAKIIKELPENAFTSIPRIQTKILSLNSHAEFRTICLTSYGNGYHEISVVKDDFDDFAKQADILSTQGKKYDQIFLKSEEVEKIIKRWIAWEKDSKQKFASIQKATVSVAEEKESFELNKKDIALLKKCLLSKKKVVESPCGTEFHFECTLQAGTVFHFSLSADGDSISTDEQIYSIEPSYANKISKLLRQPTATAIQKITDSSVFQISNGKLIRYTGGFSKEVDLVLPKEVKTIEKHAFSLSAEEKKKPTGLLNKVHVTIPKDVKLEKGAFSNMGPMIVTFEEGRTKLEEEAFFDSVINGVQSEVYLPHSIRTLEKSCFCNNQCTCELTVHLPNGLRRIEERALFGTAVDAIPKTVTYIGKEAFNGLDYMPNDLPEGVKTLENSFISLSEGKIKIPASVKKIAVNAVLWNDGAQDQGYIVDKKNPYYKSDSNGWLYSKDGKILYYAYLTGANDQLPKSVKKIYKKGIHCLPD